MGKIGLSATKHKRAPRLRFKLAEGGKEAPGVVERLRQVIQTAYSRPFSLQSDFARSNAFYVAAAASLGLITTQTSPRSAIYGTLWRTTKEGLKYLEKK